MGKKLNLDAIRAVRSQQEIGKTISLKIGEENFDVKIETSFRYGTLTKMIKWMGANEPFFLLVDDPKVLGVALILKFLTDIETGETVEELFDVIIELSEDGLLSEILNEVPDDLVNQYKDGLMKMTEEIKKGTERHKQ